MAIVHEIMAFVGGFEESVLEVVVAFCEGTDTYEKVVQKVLQALVYDDQRGLMDSYPASFNVF